MPLLLNTRNRADRLVWVIVQLLAAHGIRGLTMRRIADASRLSTSSLVHHWGSKERLLQVACFKTTRWRLDDIVFRTPREGLGAFVPQERESMLLAQAWLAWRELWRTDASLVRAGHAARGEERWLLGKAIAECCGEAVTEGLLSGGRTA